MYFWRENVENVGNDRLRHAELCSDVLYVWEAGGTESKERRERAGVSGFDTEVKQTIILVKYIQFGNAYNLEPTQV